MGGPSITTIVGGTLKTQGANAVIFIGGTNGSVSSTGIVTNGTTLDGSQPGNPVNIEGNVASTQQAAIGLIGTINNTGVVTLAGDFPWLVCEGNVTLEGGGDITMINAAQPFQFAASIFGGVLTNVDDTISGTGVIGQKNGNGVAPGTTVGTFINEAKGIIDADDGSGPLLIAGVGPDTNAGLMEATKGGTLLIDGVTIDNSLKHEKGSVEAGKNSIVGLENATIVGGFVKALPGSVIAAEQGSNTITDAHVKNAGTIGAESGDLTIVGDVNNHKGNLDANNATLVIDGTVKKGTATLEGTGEIEFGGASSADVKFASSAEGTLKLDDPLTFKGTVFGFTPGNYVDLTNIDFANNPTLHYSSRKEVLTVTDPVTGVVDKIKFSGVVGTFSAQSDGSGGTSITTDAVAVSHCQDAFVFAPHLGDNLVANGNAHNDALNLHHSEFADLSALMTEAHHDAPIHHDATEMPTLDHAMALTAQHAHLLLV